MDDLMYRIHRAGLGGDGWRARLGFWLRRQFCRWPLSKHDWETYYPEPVTRREQGKAVRACFYCEKAASR